MSINISLKHNKHRHFSINEQSSATTRYECLHEQRLHPDAYEDGTNPDVNVCEQEEPDRF